MGGIAAAPVLVVVCGDTRLDLPATMDASVFPAVQNLLLAAHALGLGSTLTTLPVLGGDELPAPPRASRPRWCPSPSSRSATCRSRSGPPRRRPLSEKAHLDRYGTPFPPA